VSNHTDCFSEHWVWWFQFGDINTQFKTLF
jgi:hypothetical protein